MLVGVAQGNQRQRVSRRPDAVVGRRTRSSWPSGSRRDERRASAPAFPTPNIAQAGATIVDTPREIFARAEMVVKVKEPLAAERKQLRPGQILFTYLHLAPDLAADPGPHRLAARPASPMRPSPRRTAACRC